MHVSILPQSPLPSKLPHNTEQSSLCHIVGPCWLFILNRARVHDHPNLPNYSFSVATISSFSKSVSLCFLSSSMSFLFRFCIQGTSCDTWAFGFRRDGLSLLGVSLLIDQGCLFSPRPTLTRAYLFCCPAASQIFLSRLPSWCHGTVRTVCFSPENLIMWESGLPRVFLPFPEVVENVMVFLEALGRQQPA